MIGRNIKTLRLENGWTQKELAERVGVKTGRISAWEQGNGTPDPKMTKKLKLELGCDWDDLFDGDE